jgi:hypothetical protein
VTITPAYIEVPGPNGVNAFVMVENPRAQVPKAKDDSHNQNNKKQALLPIGGQIAYDGLIQ